MLLEISAAGIAAPVLGAAMSVWALLICASVFALAIGYYTGGRLSIKKKTKEWETILNQGHFQVNAEHPRLPASVPCSQKPCRGEACLAPTRFLGARHVQRQN